MQGTKTSLAVAMGLAALLAGCGGGGGGAASGGSQGAGALHYTGATNPASVNPNNARTLARGTLGGYQVGASLSVTGAAQTRASTPRTRMMISWISQKAHEGAKRAWQSARPVYGAVQQINNSGACAVSGSWAVSGSVDTTAGTGSLTLSFSRCNDGTGVTADGSITVSVNGVDPTTGAITSAQINIPRISFDFGYTVQSASGSITESLNVGTNTRTQTISLVAQDSASGIQAKLQNYTLTAVYSPSWQFVTSYTLAISGRYYHSSFGYVDISTTTPLVFANATDLYPSSGGPLVLRGANGSYVQVQPISATTVQITGVDANGKPINWQGTWAQL